MDKQTSKFDNWDYVDCNKCQHYWNDTCDGVHTSKIEPCQSFLATRTSNIPKQIESLRKEISLIRTCYIILALTMMAHLLTHILR